MTDRQQTAAHVVFWLIACAAFGGMMLSLGCAPHQAEPANPCAKPRCAARPVDPIDLDCRPYGDGQFLCSGHYVLDCYPPEPPEPVTSEPEP